MSEDTTRAKILDAAGPIFADRGFQGATVRDICDAASVNLAAVNYYFGDKEQLYIETVKLARQSRAEQAPMPTWSKDTSTEQKLRDFIHTMATRMLGLETASWQIRLMMREVLHPTRACEEMVRDYFWPHVNLLIDILNEVLPADMPLYRRHQVGFSIIGQCVFYRLTSQVVGLMVGPQELQQHYTVEKLAEHITEFAAAALGLSEPLNASSHSPSTQESPAIQG